MLTIEETIEMTLDKIRPFLKREGGNVEFSSFEDGIVYVNMTGNCEGCMMVNDTISQCVEVILMEEVPGVLGVKLASQKEIL